MIELQNKLLLILFWKEIKQLIPTSNIYQKFKIKQTLLITFCFILMFVDKMNNKNDKKLNLQAQYTI